MNSKIFDWLGLSAAVICLIHCLLFPVLMILPLGLEHDIYVDILFLVVGVFAVFRVTRRMASKQLKLAFWLAIALITISVLLDLILHVHSPLIYCGAAILIGSHIINFKNHKHSHHDNAKQ